MASSTLIKLAILNNHITPYRVPVYKGLGERFLTYLLISGRELNRDTWQGLEHSLENVDVRKVWGFTLQFFERRKGNVFDPRYLHINPGYIWELLKIRPDIVISAEMGFRSLVALTYGLIFRKPVWILWGGTIHTERHRSFFKQTMRQTIFRKVKRWISYGETTTEYLLALGVSRSYILQIQNCIDERQFNADDIQAKLTLSPSPTLLYTGQLIKRKGVDLFLHAASSLQQKGHIFSILIVGNGLEKENLIKLADHLELSNITFLPGQSPSDMPAIYKSADILVFPTLEEVWGLVVNESLWSGLAVACSMYAGCASEIIPKINTFDPLRPKSFENALEKALKNELLPADTSCLLTVEQVISKIANCISADNTPESFSTGLIEHTMHQ